MPRLNVKVTFNEHLTKWNITIISFLLSFYSDQTLSHGSFRMQKTSLIPVSYFIDCLNFTAFRRNIACGMVNDTPFEFPCFERIKKKTFCSSFPGDIYVLPRGSKSSILICFVIFLVFSVY